MIKLSDVFKVGISLIVGGAIAEGVANRFIRIKKKNKEANGTYDGTYTTKNREEKSI